MCSRTPRPAVRVPAPDGGGAWWERRAGSGGRRTHPHTRLPVTPPLTHTSHPTLGLRPQADRGAVVITLPSLFTARWPNNYCRLNYTIYAIVTQDLCNCVIMRGGECSKQSVILNYPLSSVKTKHPIHSCLPARAVTVLPDSACRVTVLCYLLIPDQVVSRSAMYLKRV